MEQDLERILYQVLEQIQVLLDKEKTNVKLQKKAIVNKVLTKLKAEQPTNKTTPIQ